jgi:hypothetical protein
VQCLSRFGDGVNPEDVDMDRNGDGDKAKEEMIAFAEVYRAQPRQLGVLIWDHASQLTLVLRGGGRVEIS